jgi:hypothetical protein
MSVAVGVAAGTHTWLMRQQEKNEPRLYIEWGIGIKRPINDPFPFSCKNSNEHVCIK